MNDHDADGEPVVVRWLTCRFWPATLEQMMSKKMCEICKAKPATVPDRNRTGRLINRVCSSCHAARLKADCQRIIDLANSLPPTSAKPAPDA